MAAPTRVIHVPRRFTADEWGGTETVIARLLEQQLRQGLAPEIHTSLALSRVRRETWQGIPIRRYGYTYPFFGLNAAQRHQMDKKGGNLLSFSLFGALCLRPGVRLYHAHALKRLGGEVLTAARLRRRPFVVTLHGGVFDVPADELAQLTEAQAGKPEWGRLFGALFRSRRVLAEADAVICVGRSEADQARTALGHDRVYHLGNGVDAGRFAGGDGAGFRARHGIPADATVFACISRFDPQKDQLTLIAAFEQVAAQRPDAHLVLAGPGTIGGYVAQLDARIAAGPAAARIRRLGALAPDGPDLPAAFAATDVFVLPSRHEPFGIVVLEAWSAGRPVLVTRVGGLQALVADGASGLFFPAGDAGACATQMQRLAADPGLRERLAAHGHELAVSRYSWARVAAETENIYRAAEARAARHPGPER
ncbi:MAG: glycosyltransferase family 4 protein [Opitutaceae bacterium]|nr:glycosyltransferase family 4 protein [Opitutaceae bacterium]